jgi:outer membrane murein-binding lipoprotein Lpp
MTSARTLCILPCLLVVVAGCAETGPVFSRGTTVGSLKASVSQLEYENQQLRRKTASLEKENRQIENRLVQEESVNGELTARLDDARSLLGQRGGSAAATDVDPGPGGPGKTLPASRSSRKGRKAPFAQIPGRIDTVPPGGDESVPAIEAPSPTDSGWRGDPGPQSRRDDPTAWLPVARGSTESSPARR